MLTPDEITQFIASQYSTTYETIHSTTRLKSICEARAVTMYMIYRLTSLSKVEIGKYFKKCHTTVLHAINNVSNRKCTDLVFGAYINLLEEDFMNQDFAKSLRYGSGQIVNYYA